MTDRQAKTLSLNTVRRWVFSSEVVPVRWIEVSLQQDRAELNDINELLAGIVVHDTRLYGKCITDHPTVRLRPGDAVEYGGAFYTLSDVKMRVLPPAQMFTLSALSTQFEQRSYVYEVEGYRSVPRPNSYNL